MPDRPAVVVVSDASPLIILSAIGELRLLGDLFGEIRITPEVRQEVVDRGRGRPGSAEVAGADYIRTVAVADPRRTEQIVADHNVGRGEASSMALAQEIKATVVLMDDHQARSVAKALGIPVAGTVRILELAHERKRVTDLAGVYRKLRSTSARISLELLNQSLRRFGLPPIS